MKLGGQNRLEVKFCVQQSDWISKVSIGEAGVKNSLVTHTHYVYLALFILYNMSTDSVAKGENLLSIQKSSYFNIVK